MSRMTKTIFRKAACWLLPPVLAAAGCGESKPEPAAAAAVSFDIVEADIAGVQQALQSGAISCEELVQAYLDRIAAYDKAAGINAITVVNPAALDRARKLDQRLATAQEPRREIGDLFCVPVVVKDNFDTHDLPTTGGSAAMLDSVPPDDAFMVRRLREAGAIVVAKTNMAEWAFSPRRTESSSYGITANAYDTGVVPAGSSGGTASAVAASFALAGLGSDTGNSIRGPSSHLALFGIRSTLGLTSRDGVIPLAADRDVAGPMTRTVADGARLFTVLAGYDPADPMTLPVRDHAGIDYTESLRADGLTGMRIGVLEALVTTPDADLRVIELFRQAVIDLAAAGAVVVEPVVIPDLAAHMEADYFCPRFRYDMFVYLSSLGDAAPFLDVMSVRETGQYSEYVADELEFFSGYPLRTPPEQWDPPCPGFPDHPGRARFRDDVVAVMDQQDLDLLVYPTWTNPPAAIDRPEAEYRGDNSQLIAPDTGLPAATVPMGFVGQRWPAGLQLLARPFAEATIFQAAYAYEQATRQRRAPELKTAAGSK